MTETYPLALSFPAYRACFDADFARLRLLAPGALDSPVPACPGWTGADVVRHVAQVYLHKAKSIRTGVMPGADWPPAWLRERPAVDVLDNCHDQLVAQFDAHDPRDPAATWWPADQTVGFWLRRMAHETAVHRHDVESAVGRAGPVRPDLAVDGIDEVLALMLAGDWADEVVGSASGAVVAVESAGHRWSVTLNPADVTLERDSRAEAAATVSGAPGTTLLWLWGRGPLPAGTGDPDAVAELRARLVLATQ
ncbi:maleylpyruvate isomerase family mycothiol-dependent enzyme [Specibacter cremeus]|uniref:maleylpyruvate isomerase family mycothiol-dependent enzyme n=1 Tax=Specibacter cremeus TaxID=1629051 RepID=UPI000F78CFF4|nr:maleylpyruvate isomerase family mycothiol-dependent enzyme [Specibacter cremeus]